MLRSFILVYLIPHFFQCTRMCVI